LRWFVGIYSDATAGGAVFAPSRSGPVASVLAVLWMWSTIPREEPVRTADRRGGPR